MADRVLLRNGKVAGRDGYIDIGVVDQRIEYIEPTGSRGTAGSGQAFDLDGRLVLPGFVNAHAHLDKTQLRHTARQDVEYEGGRLVAPFVTAKKRFTVENVQERARPMLERSVLAGTTAIRTHVDVDEHATLVGLEALLALGEEFSAVLDLQTVAFPHEGLEADEQLELMEEACRLGAHVVGGKPYADDDFRDHIDKVVDLAVRHDKDLDLHIDVDIDRDLSGDTIEVGGDRYPAMEVVHLAARVLEHGYQGRVAASHLMALDSLEPADRDAVIELLREAGISVVVSPSCSLFIHGRRDQRHTRRGVTRVRELLDAGVPVAYATDNMGDAYNLYSGPNMLTHALIAAHVCHMRTVEDLSRVIEMGTDIPARIMRDADYGLAEGRFADIAVVDNGDLYESVVGPEPIFLVFKRGRLAAICHRWRYLVGPQSR